MTLQIPPRQFVALVSALGKLGHIENKDISSADITADVLATALTMGADERTSHAKALSETAMARVPLAGTSWIPGQTSF